MSEIDKQALREAAANAKIAGEEPVMPFDQRITALNDFLKHCTPATVLALLDELEAAEKRNALAGNSPVTPDGWISCSERMPDDTKMLLAFSQGQIVAAYWNWVMSPIDYKKYRAFTYLSGNILDDVTHWMPLPEPPQEVM
ncbi:DUF551 domain-containing protein [Escherichia coli]|uniref:DUF551 domain-containing protein n=1 Tax=Escherichia coli TaxID=562 RepID=UPI000BE27A8E